jgi:RNA polymerase-binding transcription factor DksA
MEVLYANQLLDEEQHWAEATANHFAEHATWDSQCNSILQQAHNTLSAIQKNKKRLQRGTFGLCERCESLIPDERLKVILTMETHYCATCAFELMTAHAPQKPASRSNSYRNYSQPAPQMAYS